MGAIPRSLPIAIRDVAVLALIAFAACVPITGLAMQRDTAEFVEHHGFVAADFSWSLAVQPSIGWARSVLVWILVVWCASRALTGRRSVWVPGALAGAVVAVRAAATLARADVPALAAIESWPGVVLPMTLNADGSEGLMPGHPALAYPPLVIALFAGAAWLGARAGRLPEDVVSRRVAKASGPGAALSAVVVGLPTLGAIGAAVAAYLAANPVSPWMSASDRAVVVISDLVTPLLAALAAAALLSGTGRLGGLATVLVAWPLVIGPLLQWLRGGTDGLIGTGAGAAVALVAAALWRPAAAWGDAILAPVREPVGRAAEWSAVASPEPSAENATRASRESPGGL